MGEAVQVPLAGILLKSGPVQGRVVAERPAKRRILKGHLICLQGALQGARAH